MKRQLAPSQQVRPDTEIVAARSSGGALRSVASLPYLPGLDGLRALAVLAVLVYHGNYAWLPGGFLGVDVFFVLSGYLITVLLLVEWQRHGRIELRAFWLRRARRLLPALFVLLPGTVALAVLFAPDALDGLAKDTLAALGYVTNWWLIVENQSYFESMGRPSLLQHLWSLAVEEQFYLLWPIVFAALMRWAPHRVPLIILVGAVGSSLLMAILYDPSADPSRLYYGTDTRATALLLGAALACVWLPGLGTRWWPATDAAEGSPKPRWSPALDLAGALALVGLGLAFFRLDEFHPQLYRGGFAAVAVVTAVAVAAVAHPRARALPRLLGLAPLRWLGTRSYGIYLWHWPIFMVTRPHLDVPLDGLELFGLRLLATLACAEVSYRLVEMPVRRGALARAWASRGRGWQRQLDSRGWIAVASSVCAVLFVLATLAAGGRGSQAGGPQALQQAFAASFGTAVAEPWNGVPSTALPPSLPPDPPSAASDVSPTKGGAEPEAVTIVSWAVDPLRDGDIDRPPFVDLREQEPATAGNDVRQNPAGAPGSATTPPPAATASAPPERGATSTRGLAVTAVGDSVMLGAVDQLAAAIPGIEIEGALGLQASAAVETLRGLRDAGRLGDAVVVHIGSNGVIRKSDFEQIMELTADVPRVVFLTVKVPRAWEERNNELLASQVDRYPNAVLVDWRAASIDEAGYFWNDGVHLRAEGARVYASLIASAINAR